MLSLAAIVVLSVSLKRHRKKDALMSSKEDARDNVIRYDDEGGGEEDTQAFDIGTLRHPEARDDTSVSHRYDLRDDKEDEDAHVYLQQRLQENYRDATEPPYDSLATFAYEGSGSIAESLSSIETHHDTDISDDLMSIGDLGPRFNTLTLILAGRKDGEDDACLPHAEGSEPRRDD